MARHTPPSLEGVYHENELYYSLNVDTVLERLKAVSSYLEQNYMDHPSLDILSKIACMSHNRLVDAFKQVYDMTISEYLQNLRVNKAKELLLNSDWNIGKIADAVGYKLHSSFSEMFKRITGVAPNEFRKML